MYGDISEEKNLSGSMSEVQSLSGNISQPFFLSGSLSIKDVEPDIYDGKYEVIPKAFVNQVLDTKNKLLTQDIIVQQVPYYETENTSGGKTIYVANN